MTTHNPRDLDPLLAEEAEPDEDALAGEIEALRRQAQADPQGFADLIRRLLVEDDEFDDEADDRGPALEADPDDEGDAPARPPTLH